MTYTPFTPKLKHVLRLFCQTRFELFFLIEAVDFKCSTLKIQVSDYLNPKENLVFQFPVSGFSSVKPALIINALLVNGVRDGVQTVLPEVMRAEGGVEPNDKENIHFQADLDIHLNYLSIPINFKRKVFDAWRKLQNTDQVTKCFLFPLATTRFNYPR